MEVLLVRAETGELKAASTPQPLADALMPLCLSRADRQSSNSLSFKEPYLTASWTPEIPKGLERNFFTKPVLVDQRA
jgi:hypothetical protein